MTKGMSDELSLYSDSKQGDCHPVFPKAYAISLGLTQHISSQNRALIQAEPGSHARP